MNPFSVFGGARRRGVSMVAPALLVPVLFVGACGEAGDDEAGITSTEGAIDNGSLVTSTSAPFSAIFRAVWDGSNSGEACTATKIHSDTGAASDGDRFLTAAHCLQSAKQLGATQVRLSSANTPPGVPPAFDIEQSWIHPSFSAAADVDGEGNGVHFDTYDVGVFQIHTPTGTPIWPTALGGGTLPDGTDVTFVGYGRDDGPGQNGGKKQLGVDRTEGQGSLPTDLYVRYANTGTFQFSPGPTVNKGDSGGPLFTGSGSQAFLWGVASGRSCTKINPLDPESPCDFSQPTTSFFTRTTNVLAWIQNPHELNTRFSSITQGFLQNRGQRQCVSWVPGGSGVSLAECAQLGLGFQGFNSILRETTSSGQKYYGFQNLTAAASTCSGAPCPACLRVQASSAAVITFNCSSTSLYQRFLIDESAAPRLRIKPREFQSTCLTRGSSGGLERQPCNSADRNQDWFFYR